MTSLYIYLSLQAIAIISMVLTAFSTFYMLLFMDMSTFVIQGAVVIIAFFVVMMVGMEIVGEINAEMKKDEGDD